eukprot:IDg10526t1
MISCGCCSVGEGAFWCGSEKSTRVSPLAWLTFCSS